MEKSVKPKIAAYLPLFFLMVIIIVSVIIGYIMIEHKDKSFTSVSSILEVQVHQMLYGNDAEKATIKVKEKLEEIEDKISYDIDGSDIDRINNGAGEKWVKSSEEVVETLDKVISISKKSNGVIDPTILPLVQLWGFDIGTAKNPTQADIDNVLQNIDYRDIKINYDVDRVKINNRNSRIMLNQVEKGVACGLAIDTYKTLKIDYGVVSVGGVVGVYGNKPDNSLWKISVKNPFGWNKEDSKIAVVKIREGYVASFGTRDDKINLNGVQRNKLFDVKTGYPIDNNIELVSVIHQDAVVADALSQVCCCLGKEKSIDLLNYYGAEAVFVFNDNSIYVTPNIVNDFSILDSAYNLI